MNNFDKIGVYQIELNGGSYVGSTSTSFKNRWRQHSRGLNKGTHENSKLQNAYSKYGANSLVFSIIEIVSDKELVVTREQHYLDLINPYYNICPNAYSCLGVKHSAETCKKMSDAAKRRRLSDETKEKLRTIMRQRIFTDEHKNNLKKAWVIRKNTQPKRKLSEETKLKIRDGVKLYRKNTRFGRLKGL